MNLRKREDPGKRKRTLQIAMCGKLALGEAVVKVKVPCNRLVSTEGCRDIALHSLDFGTLEGGGLSAPRPGRFTSGKDPVPIVKEAGLAPGPVWTCAKYLAPTRI
jgi:hypothetical protein